MLTFNIMPFLYDPAAGDLLLEARQTSAVGDTDFIAFQAGPSPDVSVIDNVGARRCGRRRVG
jgi:hypothetical protein